jgi:alanyl-tRNA synthetase
MIKLTADEMRESFLKFFESKEHLRLPSYSLVPVGDPTLLIINAGMAPLKPYFKGEAIPPKKRITTVQKCVRVGDIEQVGRTARHHTFFEMLGNFSFGDYFKREAIRWAWEYVTAVLGFPKDKLYATVHTDDDEAEQLWLEETDIPKARISRLAENFWGPVGNTGPCGPCSEILVDQGEKFGCGKPDCAPGCDCDRYLEIWNLVFTGLNKNEQGEFEKLPKPCIDTGMGFERMVSYMHGKNSTFETELFKDIIDKITEISAKKLGDNPKTDVSIKIISDHIRSVVFIACDGITPSNEGRGYVMRRLIRRALRNAQELKFGDRSLTELVEPVVNKFGHIYSELIARKDFAISIITTEEENFRRTLNQGILILESKLRELEEKGIKTLPGKDMFSLYDTYGFPAELTEEIADERGFQVDKISFEEALEEQRERARADTKSQLDALVSDLDFTKYKSQFTGYHSFEGKTIIEEVLINGKPVERAYIGDEADMIFKETCFYAESGGQVGDTGHIEGPSGSGEIIDTRSTPAKVNLHHIKILRGDIAPGDTITITVNKGRRDAIKRHHSATHLLQSALRTVLGAHIGQMGSLVDENKLRFDFSHHQSLTREELEKIEEKVNSWILENATVEVKELPVNEALKTGALAFFGEKYGDRARVVSVDDITAELCGGTHVNRTGDIGSFKITSESAVAMGIRRLEAVCGLVALKRFQDNDRVLKESALLLNTEPNNIPLAINRLWDNIKQQEKELKDVKTRLMKASVHDIIDQAKKVDSFNIIVQKMDNVERADLLNLGDRIAEAAKSSFIILGTTFENKATLIVRLTDDLVKMGFSAVPVIQKLAPVIEGSGGGKPKMSQAGGRNPAKLDEALKQSYDVVKNIIENRG